MQLVGSFVDEQLKKHSMTAVDLFDFVINFTYRCFFCMRKRNMEAQVVLLMSAFAW
jgi:hypothetical protein